MARDSSDFIYPCPFAKAYGIPIQKAWQMLKIFFIYRFISAGLLILFYYFYLIAILPDKFSDLYQFTSWIYLCSILISTPFIFFLRLYYSSLAQIFIFSDIIFISLLLHAGGGVDSGIGMLLAITVAASGILIGGRCAMLFAALASLAVLTEEMFMIQTYVLDYKSLSYSGMMGISFFSIVFLSYMLTKHSEESAILVKQHTLTIAKLEELNQYIIQHLQSGIMIIDSQQNIRLCNASSERLLNLSQTPSALNNISVELTLAFLEWQDNPNNSITQLTRAKNSDIQIKFSLLTVYGEHLYMLIIEDSALYNQHLQQTKLASLGRLTASIAHEIRNPLGAISHAAQLLSETENLQPQDQRLTEIIQNHSKRVNQIIEDVLKLSRKTPLQKQRIAMDQWLVSYRKDLELTFGEQANHFLLKIKDKGLFVYIDPGHLKQILDNLCSNALEYGRPDRGDIIIEGLCINGSPCIKVIDNGPGISNSNRQNLFEPFFTTSHKGTGLGLYISRELAQLNQAELDYANEEQCSFSLILANADFVTIEI